MSSGSDPRLEDSWGPPGLETPAWDYDERPLAAVVAIVVVCLIGIPWVRANIRYFDAGTGNQGCGAAPYEIQAWPIESRVHASDEAVVFQKWIEQHPRHVKEQFGAFCDTLLHLAARFGREDLVGPLIAAGADVEARNGLEETPLHVAASGLDAQNLDGRIEVAKVLLAAGANVNARVPGDAAMPLRFAIAAGTRNRAMVDLLLAHGADPRGAVAQTAPQATRAR